MTRQSWQLITVPGCMSEFCEASRFERDNLALVAWSLAFSGAKARAGLRVVAAKVRNQSDREVATTVDTQLFKSNKGDKLDSLLNQCGMPWFSHSRVLSNLLYPFRMAAVEKVFLTRDPSSACHLRSLEYNQDRGEPW